MTASAGGPWDWRFDSIQGPETRPWIQGKNEIDSYFTASSINPAESVCILLTPAAASQRWLTCRRVQTTVDESLARPSKTPIQLGLLFIPRSSWFLCSTERGWWLVLICCERKVLLLIASKTEWSSLENNFVLALARDLLWHICF